jgi:hypothetical protein
MAPLVIQDYLRFLPAVKQTSRGYLWSSYDAEADVLYIRYEGEEIIGLTILQASER